jgi:hypothetical protein
MRDPRDDSPPAAHHAHKRIAMLVLTTLAALISIWLAVVIRLERDSDERYFVDAGFIGAGWHNVGSKLAAIAWLEAQTRTPTAVMRRRSPCAYPVSAKYC